MQGRLAGAAVLAAVAAGAFAVTSVRAGEALPGTTVAGVDVGGLGPAQVRARVRELGAARSSGALAVTAADVRASVTRGLVTVDVDRTVDAALDGGGLLDRLLGRGRPVALVVRLDGRRLDARITEIAEQVDRPATRGGFTVSGVQVTAQPPRAGRRLDRDAAADVVEAALRAGRATPVALPVAPVAPATTAAQVTAVTAAARQALAGPYVLGEGPLSLRFLPSEVAPLLRADDDLALRVDAKALHAVVARKAARFEVAPRSAGFVVAGVPPTVDEKGDLTWSPRPAQVTVRPGRPGRAVDVDAASARLTELVLAGEHATRRVLPLTTVEPPLSTAQAQAAGVRSLLGTFTTHFVAGQPRATNIRRIAAIVDGTFVPAGEVLSLNGTAGRRTAARGFVADGAIVDGELTDEVGGGVSQFATTLFNAAFFAGLPILEHKPHSFYISRYPAGRESTVYFGSLDVRIRNDTAHGLLVRTRSTASSVTVELYGDNGGRTVTSTAGPRRPRADGGFRIDVTRTVTGGDGTGGRRVFRTSYDPAPPDH